MLEMLIFPAQKRTTAMTLQSPCDLFGMNARMLHDAINHTKGMLYIEKPDEQRVCSATSLIGLLGLGVRRGDTIRFIAQENTWDFKDIMAALRHAS